MKKMGKTSAKITSYFILGVIGILIFTIAVFIVLSWLVLKAGVEIRIEGISANEVLLLVAMGLASVAVGVSFSLGFSVFILKPARILVEGMEELSKGKYDKRVDLGKTRTTKQISEQFNTLASELENTQMLRSDFINSFSHEFKTPITSVKGLIELLKKKDLDEAKRKEYLDIIEEEISRLLDMSTKVLDLTKVESHSVLTDVEKFNLSEQIRACILLLSKKWDAKNLSLALDFDEYEIYANADLLKQVWLNLIDNAIKFSYVETELKIEIKIIDTQLCVAITNHGEIISDSDKTKIFNKFYQADGSHAREGNGIGLSIVQHIVALHGGVVNCESNENGTTFFVTLPTNTKND